MDGKREQRGDVCSDLCVPAFVLRAARWSSAAQMNEGNGTRVVVAQQNVAYNEREWLCDEGGREAHGTQR